jgi:hypothetical protein
MILTASRPYFALKPKAFDFLVESGFVEFIDRGSLDVSRLRPLPPLRWLEDLISRYNMRLEVVSDWLSKKSTASLGNTIGHDVSASVTGQGG